ncbi:MAG TPA: alpha/beta hydrolase [Gaiellaceae bacterium]|nr:alpha/beta hydrolase [Gaiellaceae bacterium]
MRVLLLHAFPNDPAMWEPQRPVLEGHDVTAPSLYGRGNSMDAWASSLLDELDGSFVVVGASMGGGCALAMARQQPDRVEAIVLAGAHAGPDAAERRPMREAMIEKLRTEGAESVWEGDGPAASADDLVAIVEALRDRPDDSATVASLGVPLLVVAGDTDPMVSVATAQGLADAAPDGRCVIVPGAGHIVSRDQPDVFNAALADFLEGL